MAGTDSKYPADDVTKPPQRRSRWWIAVHVCRRRRRRRPYRRLPDQEHAGSLGRSERSADEPSPAGSQSVPAAASAQVNAACLRVINEAQDVATILSEVGPAITAVNLQQLDDMVRRLQSIQARLDDDLRDCKVDAQVNRTPTAVPSPLSTVEPSDSPTPLSTASPTR